MEVAGGGVAQIAVLATVYGLVRLGQWIIWVWLTLRVSNTLGVAGLKALPAVARAMSWTAHPSRLWGRQGEQ